MLCILAKQKENAMNGIEAVTTARALESNIKDHFKEQKSDSDFEEEIEGRTESLNRLPEQNGHMLNTIA